jgi:PAS domain S-box-containing protein
LARNLSSSTNPLRRLFATDIQEDLFRALADRLDRAILVLATDGKRFLTCNHPLLLLTGFTRREIEAIAPAQLFAGEPGARALAELIAAAPGQSSIAENVPLHTRADDPIIVDLEAAPIGGSGSPILVFVAIAEERQQQELESTSRQQRMRGLSEVARQLLASNVANLPSALQQAGEYLAADALALFRVSPTRPDYVLDGSLPDEFPTSLPSAEIKKLNRNNVWYLGERPEDPIQKAARAAGFSTMHATLVGSENAWVGLVLAGWMTGSSVPAEIEDLMSILASLCHAAIQMSLQQASAAELGVALHGLQAEAGGQLNAVTDAVLGLDADLKVVRVNASARRLLGYPEDDLEGLLVQDILVGPEDITATLLDSLGHQRIAERPRVTLHRRDGTPFPVQLRVVPMGKDSPTRLLIVLSDQSEKKAIEDQNELLAQRALLGEVSAIFAHEVRNPINNISTGIQLVASRLGQDHPLYGSLDRVRNECNRLDQLMSDVLFFTRRLELKMEPLDLGAMLKRLLERWKPRMDQAGVRGHVTIGASVPPVLADPRTLEQVFVNLITNAIQAMPDGGILSANLSLAEAGDAPQVDIQIADTGPGISQDQVDRIFDPFFTTKKDGTGLGLAISRRIVTAHKGSIRVESFPDAGTVFTVRLPILEEPDEG